MANIIPKLNLNKTPNLVESNSLIFAKNIRLDIDGSIHRDYGISSIFDKIVEGKSSTFTSFLAKVKADVKAKYEVEKAKENPNDTLVGFYELFLNKVIIYEAGKNPTSSIVGIIPSTTEVYIFMRLSWTETILTTDYDKAYDFIICYDEQTKETSVCNCNWTYSGGEIDGCVINNLRGEKIINIGEKAEYSLVPLKCINLTYSSYLDDESLYTQTPNVPLINLNLASHFSYTIPNGVYQFFIRYKIRDDYYTDWFPASKELFSGNSYSTVTNYGTLSYVNTHTDSDESFVFDADVLIRDYANSYESFQIGFILSRDDTHYARAWKHFPIKSGTIKFDYKAVDAEELDVNDFTNTTFGLYNVGNITNFKNKLYVSNYTESNFDQDLQESANKVVIAIGEQGSDETYNGYPISVTTLSNGKKVISALKINNVDRRFPGADGIISDVINTTSGYSIHSIKECLTDALGENAISSTTCIQEEYGINGNCNWERLRNIKDRVTSNVVKYSDYKGGPQFKSDTPIKITINGKQIALGSVKANVNTIITHILNATSYLGYDTNFYDITGSDRKEFTIEVTRNLIYQADNGFQPDPGPTPFASNGDIENPGITPIDPENPIPPVKPGGIRDVTLEYKQTIKIWFSGNINLYKQSSIERLKNCSTLIPYQQYKFYIHYVKSNGEVTNGIYCNGPGAGIIECKYVDKCESIIYPTFSNIEIPKGYVACFFSIQHYAVQSSTIFNLDKFKIETGESGKEEEVAIEGTSLEMNTRLLSFRTFRAKQGSSSTAKTFEGKYYYSSDSSAIRYFGADGVVQFDLRENAQNKKIDTDKAMFAINDYESQQEIDISLVKCTPYIVKSPTEKTTNFASYTTLNLLGYLCEIYPLDRQTCIDYYNDGSSVYKKIDTNNIQPSIDTYSFRLKELSKYNDKDVPKLAEFKLKTTNRVRIYSNFNFNYISLHDDPKLALKTYYNKSSNQYASETGEPTSLNVNDSTTVMLKLIPSLTASDTYELASMYRDYPRKQYNVYNPKSISKFDNTVRSSILQGDEATISIFKFDAADYYNIPTNRGIITNLVAIGEAILVHTHDSMFKFSGSNSMNTANGDVTLKESQPFDTGVAEMFGAEFGFAGLQNKKDHIITEQGYIFFDRDSKVIYMYSGQSNMIRLSESIERLFRYKPITDVAFANDFYNNRFFVCLYFEDGVDVTLSYNISTQTQNNSFVSLHDFRFKTAFNTKATCYFVTEDTQNICTINKDINCIYEYLDNSNNIIYPSSFKTVYFETFVVDEYGNVKRVAKVLNVYDSIIDIINNDNFETVKTLDYVEWVSNELVTDFEEVNDSEPFTLKMAEPILELQPCKSLRIYTDICCTKEIDTTIISNDSSITDPESYTRPRYNQGKWSLNYFRDIQNTFDIQKYLAKFKDGKWKYDDGRNHNPKAEYISDNNSLIEGRYFVVRFKFETNFKLDTVTTYYRYKQ